VYTDNEVWCGKQSHQLLQKYRQQSGIPAKLVSVAFLPSNFSIADPKDAGMMDFVGFDSAAPSVMADFIRNP
jgi:60 kDa SS-A/Ro ribonucleoprotein